MAAVTLRGGLCLAPLRLPTQCYRNVPRCPFCRSLPALTGLSTARNVTETSPGLRNRWLLVWLPHARGDAVPSRPLRWPSGGGGQGPNPALCWALSGALLAAGSGCPPSSSRENKKKPGLALLSAEGVLAARVNADIAVLGQEVRERRRQQGKDVWRSGFLFKKEKKKTLSVCFSFSLPR